MRNSKQFTLLAVVITVLTMVFAGAWYASTLIHPAALARWIGSSVKAATGRDINIDGPVELTFFPALGVSAERVSLTNAPWASQTEMVTLKRIEVGIRIWPLLRRRIELGTLRVNGLDLYLQKNREGVQNWIFTPASPSAKDADAVAPDGGLISDGGAVFAPHKIEISDAHIHMEEANGVNHQFDLPHVSLIQSADKTEVELNARSGPWNVSAKAQITSLYELLSDWGVRPTTAQIDAAFSVNGKSILVKGTTSKSPVGLLNLDLLVSSKSWDVVPFLEKGALPTQGATASSGGLPPVRKASVASPYLFSSTPLTLDWLPNVNGKVAMQIDQLTLPNHLTLKHVDASLIFQGDRIDLRSLAFGVGNGLVQMQGQLTQFQGLTPKLALKGYGKNFSLENVYRSIDPKSQVQGGEMRVAFDLRGSGVSVHQLLGGATGKMQVTIGQATIPNTFLNDAGDFVMTVLDAINPLRKKSSQTSLECAVAYLPIKDGQITIDDSVGVQTDRLDVVLSGGVNLATEGVNLSINPREKSGLTTGLDLAGLVKLQGTLKNPRAGINQAGVMHSALSIGLGIMTGGASLVAENAKSIMKKVQPCRDAFHPWADIYPVSGE